MDGWKFISCWLSFDPPVHVYLSVRVPIRPIKLDCGHHTSLHLFGIYYKHSLDLPDYTGSAYSHYTQGNLTLLFSVVKVPDKLPSL